MSTWDRFSVDHFCSKSTICSEIRTKPEIRNAQQYLRIPSSSPLKSIHTVRNIYLLFPQQNWTYCGFQNPHRGSFSVRRISAALLYSLFCSSANPQEKSAGIPTRVNLPQGFKLLCTVHRLHLVSKVPYGRYSLVQTLHLNVTLSSLFSVGDI